MKDLPDQPESGETHSNSVNPVNPPNLANPVPEHERAKSTIVSRICGLISLMMLCLFCFAFLSQPDNLNLVTIVPVSVWLVCGVCLSLIVCHSRRWQWGLVFGWLVAAFVLGDAPQSLLRGLMPVSDRWAQGRESGKSFRVVTLNCAGSTAAIEELKELQPDVILTQESLPSEAYQQFANSSFADYTLVWSTDAAMLIRGKVIVIPTAANLTGQYVLARVELQNGAKFHVVCTRLLPVPMRFDVWKSAAWKSYSNNRVRRREQLSAIYAQISQAPHPSLADSLPLVMGGDFNAPARDGIFEILKPDLRDAWREAGRGWGKTIENDVPLQRIDAIWISKHLQAESVTAKRSSHSDHRMVIADLNF